MERLVKNITRLLARHNCVILPGVGAFLAHKVSACYNAAEKIFMPPYRTLGFNPQVVVDDALLLSEYMNDGKMSHKEATTALAKDIETLRSNLSATGVVRFGELGTFTMDIEGKIFFAPNENGIDDPDNYGFEPLAIAPLSELKRKDIVIKRSNVKRYISAVAAVIVLAFVLVPFGKKMHDDENQVSVAGFAPTEMVSKPSTKPAVVVDFVIKEPVITETVPVAEVKPTITERPEVKLPVMPIEIIEIDEEIEEIEIIEEPEIIQINETYEVVDSVETNNIAVESIEEVASPLITEPVSEEPAKAEIAVEASEVETTTDVETVIENTEKHSIIVASTPNPKKARLAITELSRKMKADYEVVQGDRRYRIAIETYDNADEANLALERIQKTFSDAWIYVH